MQKFLFDGVNFFLSQAFLGIVEDNVKGVFVLVTVEVGYFLYLRREFSNVFDKGVDGGGGAEGDVFDDGGVLDERLYFVDGSGYFRDGLEIKIGEVDVAFKFKFVADLGFDFTD